MLAILIAALTPSLASCQATVGIQGPSVVWIEQCGVRCKVRQERHAGPDGITVIRRDSCGNVAIVHQSG